MDLFWTAPPVARTLTALTFIQSILIHGGIIRYLHVLLLPKFIFRFPPQLWRLFTPFLLTGPGLSFVLDLYFMYTYGSALETGSPRFSSPGDFLTYVFFVGTVIMVSYGLIISYAIYISTANTRLLFWTPECLVFLLSMF